MTAFPSAWDLLIPNWSAWTIAGILVVVAGILILKLGFLREKFKPYGIVSILGGILLIWGVSAVQDFLDSAGGRMIALGICLTIVVGILLFYEPKEKRRRKR